MNEYPFFPLPPCICFLLPKKGTERFAHQYAVLEFDTQVNCRADSLIIGSRLDTDVHLPTCRLAFSGQIVHHTVDVAYKTSLLPDIKIYKTKTKEGVVDTMTDTMTVICRGLFTKETPIDKFIGVKVTLETGEEGVIEGSFGKSGKFNVRIPQGLKDETAARLKKKGKKKGKGKDGGGGGGGDDADGGEGGGGGASKQPVKIFMEHKRYTFDPEKTLRQGK